MKTKAYKLIVEDLSEPWHWDDVVVYANTAGVDLFLVSIKNNGIKNQLTQHQKQNYL